VSPLDRRSFLEAAAAATAGTALTGPAFSAALVVEPNAVFQYGVASGDPLPDGVILWARVTPEPDATPGSGKGAPTTVRWVVAEDAELRRVVRRGVARTSAVSDHTVKVDAQGLAPDTRYWYRFTVEGASSPAARGRGRWPPPRG
jgi:alkaline phosphatase D